MAVIYKDVYSNAYQEHLERTYKHVMDFLNQCPAIKASNLPHEDLFKLALKLQISDYPAYTTVIHAGAHSPGVYFIESGGCVIRSTIKGHKKPSDVAILGAQTAFGEECFGMMLRKSNGKKKKTGLVSDPAADPDEGSHLKEDIVTGGGITRLYYISKAELMPLKMKEPFLTCMVKMKDLKAKWREGHITKGETLPGPTTPLRELLDSDDEEGAELDEEGNIIFDHERVVHSDPFEDPNYRAPWDSRPKAPLPRPHSVSASGIACDDGLRPMDIFAAFGRAPPQPSTLDLDSVENMPTSWRVKKNLSHKVLFSALGGPVHEEASPSPPRAASAPPGALTGIFIDGEEVVNKKRNPVIIPTYVSKLRPVVHGVPHRDMEGVKRAMTPISTWSKMGLPLASRQKARLEMMQRERDVPLERAVLTSKKIREYKATVGRVPQSEWVATWHRRGWEDPKTVDVDDVPLIAEMPPAARIQYDKIKTKIHDPGKRSFAANNIFAKLEGPKETNDEAQSSPIEADLDLDLDLDLDFDL